MKRIFSIALSLALLFSLTACGQEAPVSSASSTPALSIAEGSQPEPTPEPVSSSPESSEINNMEVTPVKIPENFITIPGGTFQMGSPETEAWRGKDESLHTVTVSEFYLSPYEVTQNEYQELMGENPSSFTGEDLPVENISWLEAVTYCNALSEKEGRTPAYAIEGETVVWNRAADGYRLPTEAEWEYACRAGTETPFNTQNSISAEEANYYGHYPYQIEENYFSQGNLSTQPGQYREATIAVGSFSPNAWGLYDMHGNVSEWVWDYYGEYDTAAQTDPTGPETGAAHIYRGGGWNDFAKNMRSAYRAAMPAGKASFNIGFRLAVGATQPDEVAGADSRNETEGAGDKVLIAYFSWGGNTAGIAEEIQRQTGADLFEIHCVNPYSSDYNTVLEEAQRDQNAQARPELADHVENMEQYGTVILGYPNWWASIPMPIASFLEKYDFSGKTIIPFCSHGGGRFGQSLTAIAKLAPDAEMGEALSVHYSGGSSMPDDVANWLAQNNVPAEGAQ